MTCEKGLLTTGDLDELLCRLVDLHHAAAAKTPSDAGDGKQHRQNFTKLRFALLCQAVPQVVHGTARNRTILVFLTVLRSERALHKF